MVLLELLSASRRARLFELLGTSPSNTVGNEGTSQGECSIPRQLGRK